jgi:NitT/TauT family transport system substrate-binding protein
MPARRRLDLPGAGLDRRRFLGLALGSAAGLALAGCGNGSASGAGGTSPAASAAASEGLSFDGETVSMAVYSRNHASSPLFWERFAPEGLSVDVQVFTNPSDMNRALQAGDLGFALMGAYNTLIEAPEGFTSKIIGMVSRRGLALVARADAGVSEVADLAGMRIAVPPPGVQVLVLTQLLAEAGLNLESDLEPVPLGYADHATALESGDVDAFMGTEPIGATSVSTGQAVRVGDVYSTPLGDFNTALWASPAMQERPDLLRAAVAMQRGAAEHLSPGGENDPEVWRQLLVEEFEYTEEVYEEVLPNIGALWRFGDEQRAQFEGAGAAMLESGVLTEEPDYESLYLLDYQDE